MSETHYQILGIPRDAEEREIKRAYHRLARELHPDKAADEEKAREAEQKFAVVSTAYNVLKDMVQRAEYDRKTFTENGANPHEKAPTATAAVISAARKQAQKAKEKKPSESHPSKGGEQGLTPQRIGIAQKAFVKGCQLLKENEYAKAVSFFEAAIANNDTEGVYYARLAHSMIQARKSASKSIEAALAAIELDKYNLDFKFNLAHIYEAIGSKTNAIKVYEEILKWDSGNQVAQQMLRTLNKGSGFMAKLKASGSELLSSIRKKF